MHRGFLHVFAIISIGIAGTAIAADNPPAYPEFIFQGFQSGGTPGVHEESVQGSLTADVTQGGGNPRSFNWLSLSVHSDTIHFVCKCRYMDVNNAYQVSGLVGDGKPCPDVGGHEGLSRFVNAVELSLAGAQADRYVLTYECWMSGFGGGLYQSGDSHAAGDWCGDQGSTNWITKIAVHLRLNDSP
jgi:hypothetical protein